jgi:hypothetical protein
MILIKVTNKGSLHFLMNDGRIGVSSTSGYVRINTKQTNHFTMEKNFYQINKVKKNLIEGKRDWYDRDLYSYERVLIPNPKKRYEYLLEFESKNC